MPRSGSSMTAGIFAAHGVWFGHCTEAGPANPKGFFENTAIKRELKQRYGVLTLARDQTDFERNPEVKPHDDFAIVVLNVLKVQGWTGGPWAYKMSALYRDAWAHFKPKYVGVRRKNVVEANLKRQEMFGTTDPARVTRMVDMHNAIIDECEVIVKTDEVVAGDYTSLEMAFDYCGLAFDPALAQAFVEPDLWHH